MAMLKFLAVPLVALIIAVVSNFRLADAFFHSRGKVVEVALGASEFYFNPSKVTVPAGKVKFIVMNVGSYSHGLAFDSGTISQRIIRVKPGQSATLTVRFSEAGEVVFYCPLKGHRSRGQEGIALITTAQQAERERS